MIKIISVASAVSRIILSMLRKVARTMKGAGLGRK
jgi:hypothetical protein